MGPSWGHLGAPWGLLGPSWSLLGANLAPSWGQLGAILGPCWAILGPCWSISEPSWAMLGLLGAQIQSKSKNIDLPYGFNGFEGHLEAIWCHLGAILSQLGVQKGAGPELKSPPPPLKNGKMARKSVGKTHTKSTSRSPGSSATLFFGSRFRSMTSIVLTP